MINSLLAAFYVLHFILSLLYLNRILKLENIFNHAFLNCIIYGFDLFNSFPIGNIFEPKFPPIKIYCYNLSNRWRPNNSLTKREMVSPYTPYFQYNIEIEFYNELLLSSILTKNPNEANFFYIPIFLYALRDYKDLLNFSKLESDLNSLGPWYNRKNGVDHFLVTAIDLIWTDIRFKNDFLNSNIIYCGIYPVVGNSWRKYEYKKYITIPFVSYFPEYPFEQVDWTSQRKNKIFLTQSLIQNIRKNLSESVKKIKNHEILIFKRTPTGYLKILQELPIHYQNSDFCPCPKGDNPVAKRNFDITYFGCIPVYISDDIVLPYANILLDYSKFSLQIPEKDVNLLPEIIESYSQEEILSMRKELRKSAKLFLFRPGEPPRIGEGFWSFSWMLYIRYLYVLPFDFKYYPPCHLKYKNICSKLIKEMKT